MIYIQWILKSKVIKYVESMIFRSRATKPFKDKEFGGQDKRT